MSAGRKMRWISSFGALAMAGALTLATGAQAAATAPDSSPGTAIAIMQASAAIKDGDCAAAKAPLNLLWNDPYLENSDPELAGQFHAALIACTAQTEGLKAAIALSAENIKRPLATISAYDLHAFLQLLDQQVAPAANTLDAALTRFPDTADQITDLTVIGVLVLIQESDAPRSQALLNRLEEVHWQAHNPSIRPLIGYLRMEGLRASLKSGDDAHAALYRADIARDSLIYVMSQGDGELSDGTVPAANVRPVLSGEITDVQNYVAQSPTELGVLSYLMTLERAGDQDSLAVTQLNGIFALIDKYGVQNFQNIESYPGLLTVKVAMLADLGRYIEAEKAYTDAGTRLTPVGAVDLNIYYMGYLTDRGNETAALGMIQKFVGVTMTENQQYELAAKLACAYAYKGDEPQYAGVMAVLANQPMMRVRPALCAGDSDGAAAALIAAINDPGSRLGAINFLQTGLAPFAKSEREKALIESIKALKGRPDVVSAAQAAHINMRSWPLRF